MRTRHDAANLLALALLIAFIGAVVRMFVTEDQLASLGGQVGGWLTMVGGDPPSWIPVTLRVGQTVGTAGAWAGSFGALIGVAVWLRRRLVAMPANPAKLLSRLARNARVRDFRQQLSFRHRFGREFADVCRALRFGGSPGLVILIDDLDRCRPQDVLDLLEAVNYFITAGQCVVILGMDRRQVEHCVGVGFEDIVEGLPDDELMFVVGDKNDAAGRRRAFARHYLEKLINIEVPVPKLTQPQALAILGADAVQEREAEPRPGCGRCARRPGTVTRSRVSASLVWSWHSSASPW